MSKTKVAADEATEELPESPVETNIPGPTIVDGVIQLPQYVFGEYQEASSKSDRLDVRGKYAKGFDPTPYHFAWLRWDQTLEAERRFFLKVTKAMHGKWFREDAFDKMTKCITAGRLNDGRAELELHVRSAEADRQEKKQALVKSERTRNPESNVEGGVQEGLNMLSKAIGSKHFGGEGYTRSVGTWK